MISIVNSRESDTSMMLLSYTPDMESFDIKIDALTITFFIDVSGSMMDAMDEAKQALLKTYIF